LCLVIGVDAFLAEPLRLLASVEAINEDLKKLDTAATKGIIPIGNYEFTSDPHASKSKKQLADDDVFDETDEPLDPEEVDPDDDEQTKCTKGKSRLVQPFNMSVTSPMIDDT
jgi:hypothetical protein